MTGKAAGERTSSFESTQQPDGCQHSIHFLVIALARRPTGLTFLAASYRCNGIVIGGHDAVTDSQEAPADRMGGPIRRLSSPGLGTKRG
jgi:hypothetical protein